MTHAKSIWTAEYCFSDCHTYSYFQRKKSLGDKRGLLRKLGQTQQALKQLCILYSETKLLGSLS